MLGRLLETSGDGWRDITAAAQRHPGLNPQRPAVQHASYSSRPRQTARLRDRRYQLTSANSKSDMPAGTPSVAGSSPARPTVYACQRRPRLAPWASCPPATPEYFTNDRSRVRRPPPYVPRAVSRPADPVTLLARCRSDRFGFQDARPVCRRDRSLAVDASCQGDCATAHPRSRSRAASVDPNAVRIRLLITTWDGLTTALRALKGQYPVPCRDLGRDSAGSQRPLGDPATNAELGTLTEYGSERGRITPAEVRGT
jgi:hypothetical protein